MTTPATETASGAVPEALRNVWRRLAQGEIGSLPIILGIAVIWLAFYGANSRFLSAGNLTNLFLQLAGAGTIAVGIVLILLLGEIDLSVGAVSGLCAAIMAVLNVKHGVPGVAAIVIGLACGAAIGAFQSFWVTRFNIPSFVVTLAGSLAWLGALLYVLGDTGTVNLRDSVITGLAGRFFGDAIGWAIAAVVVAIGLGIIVYDWRQRVQEGLAAPSPVSLATRAVVIAGGTFGAVAVFNSDRGLPLAVVIFIGFVLAFDFLTRRTAFGRHVYAVGGNAEAARRAGIAVTRIRVIVFVLGSTMAAAGGILLASRLLAVNQSSGGSDLLLNVIAAAVIGGTSLFGGRGTAWSALLGALVIFSIANGMNLLGYSSSIKFIVTGAVLLAAVVVDALARRGRQAAGRA